MMGLACVALCDVVEAATASSEPEPYKAIPERNVFKLREAPPMQVPSNPPPALPRITLTGITTILGRKIAVLRVQLLSQGGQPGKEESYMLTEGQRDGTIEVLQIDENKGDVKVRNSGTEVMLNIEKDSPKVARGPTLATNTPGLPAVPVASIPPPTGGTNPSLHSTNPTNGLHRMFSSRVGGAVTNMAIAAPPPPLPIPTPSTQPPLPSTALTPDRTQIAPQ